MIELEKTYLPKYLPDNLGECKSKKIIDRYFPAEAEHPTLRLRMDGEKFTLTKKYPVKDGDASVQIEEIIALNKKEAEIFENIEAKTLAKTRYYYPYNELSLEIDVFHEDLSGLILVDVEFKTEDDKERFSMPEFCLADVTQETVIAGGMLCGKKYNDIEAILDKHGYKKIKCLI